MGIKERHRALRECCRNNKVLWRILRHPIHNCRDLCDKVSVFITCIHAILNPFGARLNTLPIEVSSNEQVVLYVRVSMGCLLLTTHD